jgi:hypothetical protein
MRVKHERLLKAQMQQAKKRSRVIESLINPAVIVFVIATLVVLLVVFTSGGDPLVLVRLGTEYSSGLENGTQGYDGQFVYYIALNPLPDEVASKLDVPAYRYQRILMPLLARALSFGNKLLLPWVLPILGILSLAGGTWALSQLLDDWGVSRWYALVYGFWAGFILALIVDLPEPLAYGLVVAGFLAIKRNKELLGWMLLMLAVFAKEVTILFVGGILLAYLFDRRWRAALGLVLVSILPFLVFQFWLYTVFGEFGIGSGGEMATSFEWIPFMGLLRIGEFSLVYLLAMLLVFGPSVILPSVWGVLESVKYFLNGQRNMIVLGLLINSLVIVFLPFSTYRETGGLLRFASGLMLAVLLFAGRYRMQRVLNYSAFWVVLNVFLLKPPAA